MPWRLAGGGRRSVDLLCYERDQGFVLARFREGEFDYLDAASEVVETEFFRYLGAQQILRALAATYPTPRQKEEVPLWVYVASNLSLRLHGVHSFHAYPYVVRCGGMLTAFGPTVAAKVPHPDTGDVTLQCAGFNAKNHYDRQTPCDQDFLRKLARDTPAEALQTWYNRDVARVLHQHQAFDSEGLFIGDASYLFVPDNPAYEGSARLLFDAQGHPVDAAALAALSPQQAARCQWRRCYKLVSLLHTDRSGSFFYRVGVRVVSGTANECPVLYALVEEVVAAVGPGVLRRLLLDRGFLDGAAIGRCKQAHGIEVLIPVRKSMAVYQDALGLLRWPEVRFTPYAPPAKRPEAPRPRPTPERVRRREAQRQQTLRARQARAPPPPPAETLVRAEVAGIDGFRSWESCPVPLSVVISRDVYADGHAELWMLLDTTPLGGASAAARRDEVPPAHHHRGGPPAAQVFLGSDPLHLPGLRPRRQPGGLRRLGLYVAPALPAGAGPGGAEPADPAPDPRPTPAQRHRHPPLLPAALRGPHPPGVHRARAHPGRARPPQDPGPGAGVTGTAGWAGRRAARAAAAAPGPGSCGGRARPG